MKGFPKNIATGQDLYNCLAMVKAGELRAEDLTRATQYIEARAFIHCPIAAVSGDKKTVTVNYCAEIIAGAIINGVKVTNVQHNTAPQAEGMGGNEDIPTETVVKFAAAFPEGVTVLLVPAPVDPVAAMGIAREQFEAIKEEIAK